MDSAQVGRIIRLALEEDLPAGDLTTETFVPADTVAEAELVAREPGVLSGGEVFARTFRTVDPAVEVLLHADDGDRFASGQPLASVRGPARGVLTGERVALNLLQRMSGIATLTAAFVGAVADSGARIVDTRKTTPGLRVLERCAVRCGGGSNHRSSLSDAVMLKDNHLALIGGEPGGLSATIRAARAKLPHTVHIEVEVDRLDQIPEALEGGADTIMLDNFSTTDLLRGVELIGGEALVEASGGVTLETVAEIAQTGVDLISVGALTHGVRALDLGLDFL